MAKNGAGVVVVTGASSGIGLATAQAFARDGWRVVLAARRGDVLERCARACEALGGQALAVVTDVTDPDAVEALAQKAEAAFGPVDVWVNNAGTGVFGPFAEAPLALHRQTLEVNLLGAVHGAYAILPRFIRRRRGILINTVSMGAWAPVPFAAAYTASKFGLRGFAASLREELIGYRDIHVCGVFPAIVDTPGLVHGANMSGRHINPGPFLYTAEDVARTIKSLAARPRDEVAVGWPARAAQATYFVARFPLERFMGAFFGRLLARATPEARNEGALLAPMPEGSTPSGGWIDSKGVPSAGTMSKTAAGALLVAGAVTLGLAAARAVQTRRGAGAA